MAPGNREPYGHNTHICYICFVSFLSRTAGAAFPGEYVIISGHMDSWDIAEGGMDGELRRCCATPDFASIYSVRPCVVRDV